MMYLNRLPFLKGNVTPINGHYMLHVFMVFLNPFSKDTTYIHGVP